MTAIDDRPARDAGSERPGPPPTVSVVIPVRDDADLLDRCLGALGRQQVAPLEVVVVDNGSTDASRAVAERHGARVVAEPVTGIPAASAAGYDAAIGDVVARLDADSVPPADWVARIRDRFAADPALDAVTGPAEFIDGPVVLRRPLASAYLGAYRAAVGAALGHTPLFGSNLAMRRDAWLAVRDHVHRFDTLMHDDMDLSVHLGAEHRIRLDRDLRVGISMRPFRSGGALRFRRGMHTVVAHWPRHLPWIRWARRVRSGAGRLRRDLRRGGPVR